VKLLFDQNLSPHLPGLLAEVFPDSIHVREAGLARSVDMDVWLYAKATGFVIVSKDSDFHQMSFTLGPPPKVIWIRRGNCSTEDILGIIKSQHEAILDFGEDKEAAFLELA
jgi:predicted nuclease of predicted toxin-antitoxin system